MTENPSDKDKLREPVRTLIWGIVWIIGGSWFWYELCGNPLSELALIRRGQTTPGFIVDTWEDVEDDDMGRSRWFHGATYTYKLPDGREYTKRTKSGSGRLKEEFSDLKQPYPVVVEYLPENPAVSRIQGDGSDNIVDWLWRKGGLGSILFALFVGPGIYLFVSGVRNIKNSRGGRTVRFR